MVPVDGKEGPADVCVIELGGTIGEFPQKKKKKKEKKKKT